MATTTGVGTSVRTQTAVHLTDVITGTLTHIVASLGLNPSYLEEHWHTIEAGLMFWIEEGSLDSVALEVGSPTAPEAVFDIPLRYHASGGGDLEFTTSQARITRGLAKFGSQPDGTSYRIVVSHDGYYTRLSGWGTTTAADRSGLSSYSLGTLGVGPEASASLRAHRRVS